MQAEMQTPSRRFEALGNFRRTGVTVRTGPRVAPPSSYGGVRQTDVCIDAVVA